MERLPDFKYMKPVSLGEILNILDGFKAEKAALLAGGTDLFIQMKRGFQSPHILIDIKGAKALKTVTIENGLLKIGACVSIDTVAKSSVIRAHAPLLSEAAVSIGNPQVRNKATIGGNISNASPAADTAVGLLALDATMIVQSVAGIRSIPAEKFFRGPGLIDLGKNEILKEIECPIREENSGHCYLKHTIRHTSDCAVVNFGTVLDLDPSGRIKRARIAFGAIAPTPIRIRKAEQALQAQKVSAETIRRAAEIMQEEIKPITDIRASAQYRARIADVLLRRRLRAAAQNSTRKITED